MAGGADFAYAQARLQARHGRRPGAPAWQALESSRTAGHCLAVARSGPLAPWIDGLDEAVDPHRIERHLRSRWRRYVDEVARWLPARWQPAVRWFGTLADLALVDAHRRGAPSGGLPFDARLAGLAAPAAPGGASNGAARWLDAWQALLPADAGDPAPLRRPAELLLPRLRGAGAARAAASVSAQSALQRLFRRHAGSAPAVLAHLALVALDVERLRGALAVRVQAEPRPRSEAT